MKRIPGWTLLILLIAFAISGCVVPDYFTPPGFSGTYHRHLFSDQTAGDSLEESSTPEPAQQ